MAKSVEIGIMLDFSLLTGYNKSVDSYLSENSDDGVTNCSQSA